MVWFSIYVLIIIACLAAYLLNKQYLPVYYQYFQYLFFVILLFELGGVLLPPEANHLLDHLYQPIEFTVLSLIYRHVISSARLKVIITYLIITFWAVSLYYSISIEGIFSQNTFSFILESVIIILYAFGYIYQLYTEPPKEESLLLNSFFWIIDSDGCAYSSPCH